MEGGRRHMASGGTNQIRLRITGPDGRVSESVSDQDSIILGSGSGAAVRIPDPHVSNLHLMLKRERNGHSLVNIGTEWTRLDPQRAVKLGFDAILVGLLAGLV